MIIYSILVLPFRSVSGGGWFEVLFFDFDFIDPGMAFVTKRRFPRVWDLHVTTSFE